MPAVTEPKLIAGNANQALAKSIARRMSMHRGMSVNLVDARVERFNDQEIFVEVFENVRGEDMYVIQPTSNPANDNLMELLIMVDALRRSSASRITAVIPYFGYARQDRRAKARTPITAKLVANMIAEAGVDRVLTMDLHAAQIQGFFDIPVDHLYAAPVLIRHLREHYVKDLQNLVVVSPDVGGVKMARAYSDALGAELAIVAKHRVNATHVEAMNVIGDVEGRDAVLIDDMTETAGTLCAAANILKERGAQRVFACVSHGVLGDMARERIAGSCIERVLTSDTVPMAYGPKVDCISVGDLLGHAVQRIHDGESVSSLFDI